MKNLHVEKTRRWDIEDNLKLTDVTIDKDELILSIITCTNKLVQGSLTVIEVEGFAVTDFLVKVDAVAVK